MQWQLLLIMQFVELDYVMFLQRLDLQLNRLILRAKQALPSCLELNISFREQNENQIDWYARVDAL